MKIETNAIEIATEGREITHVISCTEKVVRPKYSGHMTYCQANTSNMSNYPDITLFIRSPFMSF